MSNERVLVTGGSGFVGVHCIIALLNAGYRVRTTVRSLEREPGVRAMLARGGIGEELAGADAGDANLRAADRIEFVTADLESDDGWADAVADCTYVLHVASPFPGREPKDENELIVPARDGALRVLRAARDAGVKRVVLTSSFAAIGYGTKVLTRPYTEADWTDPAAKVSAYVKSKTIAEHAAWSFIESQDAESDGAEGMGTGPVGTQSDGAQPAGAKREGGNLELAVVNPVIILGPALGTDLSTSISLIARILKGGLPALPHLSFGIVDVRDVADLHVLAMTNPAANGERFLAVSDDLLTIAQMATTLRELLGPIARKVPKLTIPNWLVRAGAVVVPALREFSSRLDDHREVSNTKAKTLLGWSPRQNGELLVDTAMSLVDLGLVPAGPKA